MWSAELIASTRTASSPRATARCSSSSSSIWVSIALRDFGPLQAQHRDALRIDFVAGHRAAGHAHRRTSFSTSPSVSSAARSTSASTSLAGLAEAPEHVGRDDLGIGRVGPPHADPHPPELGVAEAALEALQAVVAGQAAAEADADLTEGQVDLVVEDDDAVERHLERAARRAGRVARAVHVRLRQEDRHPRAAGAGPPFGQQAAELRLRLGRSQRRDELGADLEADVVAGRGVALPGLPRPTIRIRSPSCRPRRLGGGGERSTGLLPAGVARVALGAALALGGGASPSSPTSSVSSSTSGSGSSSTRGGERVAMVTSSSSSATRVTPSGTVSAES